VTCLASTSGAQALSWRFEPSGDTFSTDAIIDLRKLNERQAGSHGFLRVTGGGDFAFEDGTPVRFWCVGSSYARKHADMADVEHHARWLAKRGVNMARFHGFMNPDFGSPFDINASERAALWRMVAGMKRAGIYVTVSVYWAVECKVGSNWGIPEYSGKSPMALLFFNDTLQTYYKEWLRKVFTATNPQTGIPLKDDPALAIIQLQNEDSFLFPSTDNMKASQKAILSRKFGDFLVEKYGSLDSALAAWNGVSMPTDTFSEGVVGLAPVSALSRRHPDPDRIARISDQLEFYTMTMYRFNADMASFLHDSLGCQQIINAGNWKTADDVTLSDHERYSYTANDVVAKNHYYGGKHQSPNGTSVWAIVDGDRYTDPSGLLHPRRLPLNYKQVVGHPHIISESMWVPPMGYQSEAPFLVSVYSSLTGQDGYYWFNAGEKEWRRPSSANGYLPSIGKWVCQTPCIAGQWPAAALLYRWYYVRTGAPVVVERRKLQDMWDRFDPIIAETSGFDPLRDDAFPPEVDIPNGINPLAFLAGPVHVEYGTESSSSSVADLTAQIDESDSTVTSTTGEVVLDYRNGIGKVNASRAQGVCGFLSKVGTFEFDDVRIVTTNPYASVLTVSLTGEPIAESRHILVQVGTLSRPTGWETRPVGVDGTPGFEIVDYGGAPWQVKVTDMTVGIRNTALTQMAVLDMNGEVVSTADLEADGEYRQAKLPSNAMYAVFRDPDAPLDIGTPPPPGAEARRSPRIRMAAARSTMVENLSEAATVDVFDIRGRRVETLHASDGRVRVSAARAGSGMRVLHCHGADQRRLFAVPLVK